MAVQGIRHFACDSHRQSESQKPHLNCEVDVVRSPCPWRHVGTGWQPIYLINADDMLPGKRLRVIRVRLQTVARVLEFCDGGLNV